VSVSNQEEKAERKKNVIEKVVTGKDMEQHPLITDKNYKYLQSVRFTFKFKPP